MNLLFKKNFHETKSSTVSKGVRKSVGTRTTKTTGGYGNSGYSPVATDERYFRTHLFFGANRNSNAQDYEEKCGPVLASISSHTTNYNFQSGLDQDLPQPLVIRSGPDSIQWTPLSEFPRNSASPAKEQNFGSSTTPTTPQNFTYNMASSILRPNTPSPSTSQNQTYNTSLSTSNLRAPSPAQSSASSSPNPQKQVNFRERSSDRNASNMTMKTNFNEPITLGKLNKDCFIIPMHRLSRFLPAGLPLPESLPQETDSNNNVSVLETSEQKYSMLVHLMSPLEPVDPMLESPLSHPSLKQRTISMELLMEVNQSKAATSGVLLANMERNAEFPFVSCYILNNNEIDPTKFYNNFRNISLNKFDPRTIRYNAAHTLDLYSEVAAICKPPIQEAIVSFAKGQTCYTGYIITVFKVFDGDDGEIFERNWLYWSGARVIYRYMSTSAGLRRISLHKSVSSRGDKMYLLVCECASLLQNITAVTAMLPTLRARLCGYTALYRPLHAF